MKQKLSPGMVMDIVSPEELAQHLDSHGNTLLKALGKNAQFKRAIGSAEADANGNVTVTMSPPDGFLWELKFIQSNISVNTNANFYVYINDIQNINLFGYNSSGSSTSSFFPKCVVHSNEKILIQLDPAVPALANTQISIQLWVIEVPNSHEAQLLL